MNDVMDAIRQFQASLPDPDGLVEVPVHMPEMLLIGCVDARLNPASDIGIPYGKSIIVRNIAALIAPFDLPTSARAALAFAVDIMRVKHIAVMGHTDCGGIRACLEETPHADITAYLKPLETARDRVRAEGGNVKAQATSMERQAVRQSLQNLMTYPVIQRATKEKRLTLHGWVIDTATARLQVLDHATGKFRPMEAA